MDAGVRREFDNKIRRLTGSRTYLDYCREVYGYRMYLFNMADKEQLDYIFKEIPISRDDTVLDIGCGTGSILNALAGRYGCSGIGIDQLSGTASQIDYARARYISGDIDDFKRFNLHPTVTLSVDSIYFCSDAEDLIRDLIGVSGNRIYLFYSQYIFDGKAMCRDVLRKDCTKVAETLKKLGAAYTAVDYSQNERALYGRSLSALEKRKASFASEGNADLYDGLLNEQRLGAQLYEAGNASRYLYIIG